MSPIPKISNRRLEELVRKIKPVVRMARVTTSRESRLVRYEEGDLYFIEGVNPRTVAFTWDPIPTSMATRVNPNSYKKIETIHDYGAPVFFKPSIAEVLAQIPKEDIGRCVAFETDLLGFTDDNSYHTAVTRLYEKK